MGRPVGRPPRDPMERYLEKIDRSAGPDGCWPWTKGVNSQGYGRFKVGGKTVSATRWGYANIVGPIPNKKFVLHHCDNPPCHNPKHWFLGTNKENMDDMKRKGRQNSPTGARHGSKTRPERLSRGEKHYAATLTDAQVSEIKRLWMTGDFLQRELAEQFSVRQSNISRIVNGKRRRGQPASSSHSGSH